MSAWIDDRLRPTPTRLLGVLCAGLVLFSTVADGQEPIAYQSPEETLPKPVAPQPVEFSHKLHAEKNLVCADCHRRASEGERAGLPTAEQCLTCHRTIVPDSAKVEPLLKFAEQGGGEIPWIRVYETPPFVFFSHSSHVNGGVACAECHGPVAVRETLTKEVSTSMTACMNCHAARNVPNHCYFCHTLGH